MQTGPQPSRWPNILAATLAGLGAVAIFFRGPLSTSFQILFGDDADTLIGISILEHWRAVFAGTQAWTQTAYFFPHANTLGYNDGLLLYGVVYGLFRAAHLDPFLSNELVNIVLKLVGYVTFVLFGRRACRLPTWVCIVGAVTFTLANNSFVQVGHSQLLSVALVPLMALLLFETKRAMASGVRVRAMLWSTLAGFLLGAWLLTSFYTIWFFGLFCLIMMGVGLLLTAGSDRRQMVQRAQAGLYRSRLLVAGSVVVWMLALVPFLLVYLPIARESEMHTLSDVSNYWPSLLDVVHVGPGNLLFGGMDARISAWRGPDQNMEHLVGFPLSLLVMALLSGYRPSTREQTTGDITTLFPSTIAIAALVCLLLVIHIGPLSLWELVYYSVPGAKAIRSTGRFLVVLMAPLALLASYGLARLQAAGLRPPLLALAALLLMVGEFNTSTYENLSRPLERLRMTLIQTPPVGCTQFFAIGLAPAEGVQSNGLYHPNVDAMLIAAVRSMPTVNGYSTFNPPDWNFDVSRSGYLSRVGSYAFLHGLSPGLCALNVHTGRWTRPRLLTPDLAYGQEVRTDGKSGASAYLSGGWSTEDPGQGVWSIQPYSNLVLKLPKPQDGNDLVLDLKVNALTKPGTIETVSVTLNGAPAEPIRVDSVSRDQRVRFSSRLVPEGGLVNVVFHKLVLRTPYRVLGGHDKRYLGFYLRSFCVMEEKTAADGLQGRVR